MSYCPNPGVVEPLDWISQRNWNRLIQYHAPETRLPVAFDGRALSAKGGVRVIAIVEPNGHASIFNVAPGQRTLGAPTPGSPYRMTARPRRPGRRERRSHDQPRAHRPCRPAPIHLRGPGDDAPIRTEDRRCDAQFRRASPGSPGSQRARSEREVRQSSRGVEGRAIRDGACAGPRTTPTAAR